MEPAGTGWKKSSVAPGQLLLLSAFFFLPALIPAFFGWLSGLMAVPVFYLFHVNGVAAGKTLLACSLLLAGLGAFLVQELEVFLFSLTLIPLGFSLFRSAHIRESAAVSGGKGLLTLGLTWFLFWSLEGVISGTNPYRTLLQVLDLGFQQTLGLYNAKEAGLSQEMADHLRQATNSMREIIPRLLPGLLTTMTIVTVWINMVAVNTLAKRCSGSKPWGNYATWKLPDPLVWLPITAITVLLLGTGTMQDAGGWLLMISGLLYCFQGIAVLVALMERWRVPVAVKVILTIVCVMQSYGLIVLAILGLCDVWFNLRGATTNNET